MKRISEEVRIKQVNELPNIEFLSFVDGYKNNKSKANVRCSLDGYEWITSVNDLVNGGKGCPQCAGLRRWTAEERIEQIKKLENIEFVSWVNGYKNAHSKAIVRCKIDGFERSVSINHLLNNGRGCPHCSGKRRWTTEERIEHINSLENILFVSWCDCHNGKNSKANVICNTCEHEWCASVDSLVNQRCGCPYCSKHGFQFNKDGYLYALRSECGQYVKVGISNKPSQRHRRLELATPFRFSCVEIITGDGIRIYELEKYFHNKYERAGFTGFDGATEWLICRDELLGELRSINA